MKCMVVMLNYNLKDVWDNLKYDVYVLNHIHLPKKFQSFREKLEAGHQQAHVKAA